MHAYLAGRACVGCVHAAVACSGGVSVVPCAFGHVYVSIHAVWVMAAADADAYH